MADLGPHAEYALLPVDIPVPNVVRETFISGVFKAVEYALIPAALEVPNTARRTPATTGLPKRVTVFGDSAFGGSASGPTRGINMTTGPTAPDGLGLGNGAIGRRDDVGDAGSSQILNAMLHRMLTLIPVEAGNRTVAIKVRYWPDTADDRPALLVKRNLAVGVQDDIEVVAPAGGSVGFVTISLPVAVTSKGVLECYRRSRSLRHDSYTFWDSLTLA